MVKVFFKCLLLFAVVAVALAEEDPDERMARIYANANPQRRNPQRGSPPRGNPPGYPPRGSPPRGNPPGENPPFVVQRRDPVAYMNEMGQILFFGDRNEMENAGQRNFDYYDVPTARGRRIVHLPRGESLPPPPYY